MKRTLLSIIACAGITAAWAQDGCIAAIPITAGVHTVAAVDGPVIPDPICAPSGAINVTASEWFTYTPSEDRALTITTEASGVDTRFHVYTGACGNLICVGGDDDSGGGLTSLATINVVHGVTYHIAFDNRWTSTGFDFELLEGEPGDAMVTFTTMTLPVSTQCVVDMDGDMLDDAVATGTNTITIAKQLAAGGFTTVSVPCGVAVNSPSWSIAAGDLDDNGHTDLLYGGGGGCSIMMANDDGTYFDAISPPQYIFSQRTNMVDINADGNLDVFVCHDVAPNVYFYHDGNGNFIYTQGGLGDNGGNYGSIWTDFDNDHDIDMFIAKCGSSPPDVLMQNNGNGTFTNVAGPLGLADGQQSWSSAWGDFDNDGDMDILVGSSSSGYHKLMQNSGVGTFTNVTAGSGFDTFTGQSIEWTTHDFNNDGYLDVLGGGGLMMNNGDMTFSQNPGTLTSGPIGDMNNDGFMDLVMGNTAYLNDGNDNNWIKVHTTGTISTLDGIGARVQITTPSGIQIRDIKSGDGFRYMSTITGHFGIGLDTEVYDVTVYWPSGIVQSVSNPPINGILEVIEGLNTGVNDRAIAPGLMIFPNPAEDVLNITADTDLRNAPARVFDAAGKQVMAATVSNGRLDVSKLTTGIYLLQVTSGDRVLQQRFTKE